MKIQTKTQNPDRNVSAKASEKGFSLIEVMVAMIIFLVVTGSIYGLLQVGRLDRNRSSRRNDMLKNARLAVHLIGRDTLNAGLRYNRTGGAVPVDFLSDQLEVLPPAVNSNKLTSIMAGNDLTTASNLAGTDVIGFVSRDMASDNTTYDNSTVLPIANVNPSTAQIEVTMPTLPTLPPQLNIYDLYLLESSTSQRAVMATAIASNLIDFSPTDPLGLNVPKCAGPVGPGCSEYKYNSLKKITLVTYKVNQQGVLVRTIYGNNTNANIIGPVEQFLAYNVQDLQISYVLDNGEVVDDPFLGPDGAPGGGDDDAIHFNGIRQVTVNMTVQATEADEQMGQPQAITLNSTFAARNMEYPAG